MLKWTRRNFSKIVRSTEAQSASARALLKADGVNALMLETDILTSSRSRLYTVFMRKLPTEWVMWFLPR